MAAGEKQFISFWIFNYLRFLQTFVRQQVDRLQWSSVDIDESFQEADERLLTKLRLSINLLMGSTRPHYAARIIKTLP